MEKKSHEATSDESVARRGENGFTMVEIVVSMFLIGIIAVSVLPVLMQALKATAVNITIATATQMLNEQLDTARGSVRNCSQLHDFLAATPPSVTDSQKVVLQAKRTGAEECSDTKLGAALVTITVTRGDTHAIVSEATTMLAVLAATPAPTATPTPSPSGTTGP